jgi:hypothetical protein
MKRDAGQRGASPDASVDIRQGYPKLKHGGVEELGYLPRSPLF